MADHDEPRALVTGGAGFIGSHLTDRLLSEGWAVTVVDNLASGRGIVNLDEARASGGDRLRFVERDITEPGLEELLADARPDLVFHLAAQMDVRVSVRDPVYDNRVNVLGTVNLLHACVGAGVGKVVFTSSGGCIYGPPDATPIDETFPTHPHSPYGASKLCAEVYLDTFRLLAGLDYTTLALGNVYGPRQDPHGEAGVVAIFGTAMLEGRPTTIFGDGTSSRDYVHVSDVVDALVRAATRGAPRRYNVGTGVATTVRELHAMIADAVGAPDEPQWADPRPAELPAITLDCALADQELGWTARQDLANGLSHTVTWLREMSGN
jgi:UDP-glucose 4-epimerase